MQPEERPPEPTRVRPASPSPSPSPPADAPAPNPPAEGPPRSEAAEGGREGSAGGPCLDGAACPALPDPAGSAAGSLAARQPERRAGDPGEGGSGSVAATQLSTQEAAASHHSEEQMQVMPKEMEEAPAMQAGPMETCSQTSAQNAASSQRGPGGQLKGDSPPLEANNQEESHLMARIHKMEKQISFLMKEVSYLKQKFETLENSQGPSGLQLKLLSFLGGSTPVKVFSVLFRTTGRTDGCEQKFLEDISNLLSKQSISLKVEEFTETSSKDLLLLVFCPIASRMGPDIQNALAGLSSKQKVLLVVMHYARVDITKIPIDSKEQVGNPALVRTVHTRYTIQEGIYPCKMNKRAVADVAAAIKDLAGDH